MRSSWFKYLILSFLGFVIACSDSELVEAPISRFPSNPDLKELPANINLINDNFEGEDLVIIGDANDLFIVSFHRNLYGELLDFTPVNNELPVIMQDSEGNKWDVFGYAVSGKRKGQRLQPTESLIGYWFSIATFYPGTEIFPENDKGEFQGEIVIGSDGWLVPEKEIRSGGVGKDGIPALSDPNYTPAPKVDFLRDRDLVIGFSNGTTQKAYPHSVLDWHEIVNDQVKDFDYSIIYCPLTGTGTAWNRNINGSLTTFGVSGLLFNTNIIPYDRATESNWSQIFDRSIYGEMKGERTKNFMVVETTWQTWKKMYPDSKVVNLDTGFSRDYGKYPYGSTYKNDAHLLYPVAFRDKRLHEKERVHAILVNGKARVYRFDSFL